MKNKSKELKKGLEIQGEASQKQCNQGRASS